MHVLDTKSADTSGPNYLWLYFQGTYKIHLYANISVFAPLEWVRFP